VLVKLFRPLLLVAAVLLVARPAEATSISILVGDKDGFGAGTFAGTPGTWTGAYTRVTDDRSAAEKTATDGAQLTDVYSALYYYGVGSGCDPATDPGCSPNGDQGSVFFPLTAPLSSGSITMLMGDFECSAFLAMTVDINGINVPFCFDDGFQVTKERTFTLSPDMIAAANLAGRVQMNFDHRAGYVNGVWQGSYDYIAFDYFELNAEAAPVPEPATLALLALGLAGLAARRRLRRR
jgi:hypothetical protein